jgi:hypothetical protein
LDKILAEIELIKQQLFILERRCEKQRLALDSIGIVLFNLRDDIRIVESENGQLDLNIA